LKKGGGKKKGSEFERWVCKKLSLAISKGKRDDIFWRSAMSGGRATVKFKKGGQNLTQVGDITAIDPLGNKLLDKFVIECKRYKNIHVESFIYMTCTANTLNYFWNEVTASASKCGKKPLLIFKENFKPCMVMIGVKNIVGFDFYASHILPLFYEKKIKGKKKS